MLAALMAACTSPAWFSPSKRVTLSDLILSRFRTYSVIRHCLWSGSRRVTQKTRKVVDSVSLCNVRQVIVDVLAREPSEPPWWAV